MQGTYGEILVRGGYQGSGLTNVMGNDMMAEVDYQGMGRPAQNNPFHDTDILILVAEIG